MVWTHGIMWHAKPIPIPSPFSYAICPCSATVVQYCSMFIAGSPICQGTDQVVIVKVMGRTTRGSHHINRSRTLCLLSSVTHVILRMTTLHLVKSLEFMMLHWRHVCHCFSDFLLRNLGCRLSGRTHSFEG